MVNEYVTKNGFKYASIFLAHAHRRKSTVIISIDFENTADAKDVLRKLFL